MKPIQLSKDKEINIVIYVRFIGSIVLSWETEAYKQSEINSVLQVCFAVTYDKS